MVREDASILPQLLQSRGQGIRTGQSDVATESRVHCHLWFASPLVPGKFEQNNNLAVRLPAEKHVKIPRLS